MTTDFEKIIFDPYAKPSERLDALNEMKASGALDSFEKGEWVNNHIHTTYSFSPYTPTSALFMAYKAGLKTAGIMDHDSVGGASEFIEAGKIIGMPTTVGCEMRVSVKGTVLDGRRLNNPDQKSCAYVALHGIPHQNIERLEAILSGLREKRNNRNRKMCANINELCKSFEFSVDFEADVLPLSQHESGGSVTERHVLYALVNKICDFSTDRGEALSIIEKLSGKPFSKAKRQALGDAPDNFYKYDLLGILKSGLIEKIYVDADEELLHISEYIALGRELGAVSAYAYLGDVGESPTGDKKAQKFEDDYLDMLFEELDKLGFNAVTYMPSRNTGEQLDRVMKLCDKYGFFQISGEDINSPRQSFICPALEKEEYAHLKVATYALIGHEIAATECFENGMFADEGVFLYERIKKYAAIGGYNR